MRYKTVFLLAAGLGILSAPARAVSTDTATQVSYLHFEDGKLENIAIPAEGGLKLAPVLERVAKLDAAVIWRAITDSGGNIYVGTGNAGKVFKVSPDGKAEVIFEPGEVLTRALTLDEKGNLYIGTSPDGYIYRLAPGGRPEVYFHPGDTYIWDLKFDAKGNLFVATGAKGRVYRLPPDYQPGQPAEVYFETDRTHISCLAFDKDGSLLAGAGPRSLVYRITDKNKASVLASPNTQEISEVQAASDGSVYFTTFNRPGPAPGGNRGSAGTGGGTAAGGSTGGSSSTTSDDNGDAPGSAPRPPSTTVISGTGSGRSQFMRVTPAGLVEPVWWISTVGIYGFRALPDGHWLLASDQNGRMFSVASMPDWELLQEVPDGGEVTALLPVPNDSGATLVFSSNPAQIHRLGSKPAARGVYTAEPFDGDQTVRWGTLRALALPPMPGDPLAGAKWETRTGNTPKPDSTWTDWQAVGADTQIASRPGRFFQYRVTLTNSAESVRRLSVYFQRFNSAPMVDRVGVVPAGVEVIMPTPPRATLDIRQITDGDTGALQPLPSRPQVRPTGEAGGFSIGWHATDPDGDSLQYTVQLSAVGDDKWATLADELDAPVYSFSSRGFADGYYQVRVIATDKLDNPPGEARTGERISTPFLIDNTPPAMTLDTQVGNAASYTLTFRAKDAASVLQRAQYTLDGQPAKPALPDGGMFDKPELVFRITAERLKPGSHSVVFEVTDSAGNTATAKANFDVP